MPHEGFRATRGRTGAAGFADARRSPTRHTARMSNLKDIADYPLLEIWGGDAVRARRMEGERITFALVELAPNAVVPEHTHEQEQLGMVITGQVTFTLDGETRTLGP